MGKIIGIDLGTTNSLVAVLEGGEPVIVPNKLGHRITPSTVRFLPDGQVVVGEHAYNARIVDPRHTITGIKRFIGRRFNEVADIASQVPYEVVVGQNNLAMVRVHGREYSPQLISAYIINYLKESAELYLGVVYFSFCRI